VQEHGNLSLAAAALAKRNRLVLGSLPGVPTAGARLSKDDPIPKQPSRLTLARAPQRAV